MESTAWLGEKGPTRYTEQVHKGCSQPAGKAERVQSLGQRPMGTVERMGGSGEIGRTRSSS